MNAAKPRITNTRTSQCNGCTHFHSYNWSLMEAALLKRGLVKSDDEFVDWRGVYQTSSNGRCLHHNKGVPRTDWCKNHTPPEDKMAVRQFPVTEEELAEHFPAVAG